MHLVKPSTLIQNLLVRIFSASKTLEYLLIQDMDISGLILDDSPLSSVHTGAASSSTRLEALDKELSSILAQMMVLPLNDDHKPDVEKLFNWLVSHDFVDDELNDNVVPLKENILQIMTSLFETCIYYFSDGDIDYLMKIVSLFDFLTIRYPILEEIWDTVEHFGQIVAEKLKQHRVKMQQILIHDKSHEYHMGLKTLAQPRELLSIIALLKYVCKQDRIEEVSKGLCRIVRIFKVALQEPELLDVTTKCVMDVMESLFKDEEDIEYSIYDVDILLELFCKAAGGDCMADKTPVGLEIIKRYKKRICKLRTPITEEILDDAPMIYSIIYNKEY